MANEKRLIDGNKAQAVLVNMAEHLMEAGNPEMAGAVGYAAEVIGKQPTVDAVVLPCKVGDTVWIVGDKFPAEIEEIRITNDGVFFAYVEYDRGYEETEVWDNGEFQTTDIGKTVFLTGEEAEQALAKMDGGNEDANTD